MAEITPAPAAPSATLRYPQFERWFYVCVALLMILFNVVAFGPSIIDTSRRNSPLPFTSLVTLHVVVSVAWLLLFLTQSALISAKCTALHRRLGVFGFVLTVAFVVVGYFAVIAQARRGYDLSGDLSRLPSQPGVGPVESMVGQLFFFLTFGILVGAALWYRNRPSVHKRLILLAICAGLSPTPVAHVIGHWSILHPWVGMIFPASLLVFLSLSAIYDLVSERRIHPVSLWVGIFLFISNFIFNVAVVPSSAWREFATWLIQ